MRKVVRLGGELALRNTRRTSDCRGLCLSPFGLCFGLLTLSMVSLHTLDHSGSYTPPSEDCPLSEVPGRAFAIHMHMLGWHWRASTPLEKREMALRSSAAPALSLSASCPAYQDTLELRASGRLLARARAHSSLWSSTDVVHVTDCHGNAVYLLRREHWGPMSFLDWDISMWDANNKNQRLGTFKVSRERWLSGISIDAFSGESARQGRKAVRLSRKAFSQTWHITVIDAADVMADTRVLGAVLWQQALRFKHEGTLDQCNAFYWGAVELFGIVVAVLAMLRGRACVSAAKDCVRDLGRGAKRSSSHGYKQPPDV